MERKKVRHVHTNTLNISYYPSVHLKALFTLQRLEEIMKRTRRSDTAEKVMAKKILYLKNICCSCVFILFLLSPSRKLFLTGMETMQVTYFTFFLKLVYIIILKK